MENNNGTPASQEKDILALAEEKISNDNDFQEEIADLSEEEKEQKISERKSEVIKQEYATLAEKAKKAEEVANNQRIRAEKAEKKPKDDNQAPKNNLSPTDIIALAKADVSEDDIQEVLDYAEYKKISVKDALVSTVIKSLLAEKKEERQTAQATAVKQQRRGQTSSSGSEALKKAETTGEMPTDKDGMDKLVDARFNRKVGK